MECQPVSDRGGCIAGLAESAGQCQSGRGAPAGSALGCCQGQCCCQLWSASVMVSADVSQDWFWHWSRSVQMSVRVGICQGQCGCQSGSLLALVKVMVGVGVSQGQCCCQSGLVLASVKVSVAIRLGQLRSVLLSEKVRAVDSQGHC